MAYSQPGWSPFTKITEDKDKKKKEVKKSADFKSYDDMINSARYKSASKSKERKSFTYWEETQDYPGGEKYKKIFEKTLGE